MVHSLQGSWAEIADPMLVLWTFLHGSLLRILEGIREASDGVQQLTESTAFYHQTEWKCRLGFSELWRRKAGEGKFIGWWKYVDVLGKNIQFSFSTYTGC